MLYERWKGCNLSFGDEEKPDISPLPRPEKEALSCPSEVEDVL